MSRGTLTVALALLAVVAVAVVGITLQQPASSPTSSPSPAVPTIAALSPTPTPGAPATTASPADVCRNEYQVGDTPVVSPRKSGRFAEVAVDAVWVGPTEFGNTTRWLVRAFVPAGSPGRLDLPLRASVRTAAGAEIDVVGYHAGPPNAGAERVTSTVSVAPCDAAAPPGVARGKIVLVVHTAPISSGTYTLTLRDLGLPEGGTREETWPLTLTCGPATGQGPGAMDCR